MYNKINLFAPVSLVLITYNLECLVRFVKCCISRTNKYFSLGKLSQAFSKISCTLDLFSIKSQESKKKEINEPELDENLHMQTENNNRMVCGKKF